MTAKQLTHERLVEKVAEALCDARTWSGAWMNAADGGERDAYLREARAIVDLIARETAEATPEMIEAWEEAATEAVAAAGRAGRVTAAATARAAWEAAWRYFAVGPRDDWRAMHEASALWPRPDAPVGQDGPGEGGENCNSAPGRR